MFWSINYLSVCMVNESENLLYLSISNSSNNRYVISRSEDCVMMIQTVCRTHHPLVISLGWFWTWVNAHQPSEERLCDIARDFLQPHWAASFCPSGWLLLEKMILFSNVCLSTRNQLGDLVGRVEAFEIQDSILPREEERHSVCVCLSKGGSDS